MQRYVVEFIGTFFLFLTIGISSLREPPIPSLAVGTVLIALVYMGRPISGAHFNPAITISLFLRQRCAGKDLPGYLGSQFAGGLLAAFLVSSIFAPALPGDITPLKVGSSIPIVTAELLFTFFLAFVIHQVAASDRSEGNAYHGVAIGLTVMTGSLCVSTISLASFNPAVSAGFCSSGFFAWSDLWMHALPQFLGAILAAFTYRALHPEDA